MVRPEAYEMATGEFRLLRFVGGFSSALSKEFSYLQLWIGIPVAHTPELCSRMVRALR